MAITHEFLVNLAISIIGGISTFICVYNLCIYFNVDEKDVVKRLIAIKNHEYKNTKKPAPNDFTKAKSKFKFEIFSKILDIRHTDFIKKQLERADISMQVDTFILISLMLGAIPLLLALFISLSLLTFCPVGLCAPSLYVKYKIKKRSMLFTQQLPDALDLLCNALRAGHSLFSAFGIIVNEMPSPINKIFKVLTDEIALGVDVKDAMKSLQNAVPDSVDLRFFTTVVILQREIGGNLIKLLEILAKTIRERFKMIGQLKAQTMQARLSGFIVSAVPPIIGLIIYFVAPDYTSLLFTHPWGKAALWAAAIMMIIGFYIINKITDIEM